MFNSRAFKTWQVTATYMGAIIGAGFASGQELLRFFVVFGKKGFWGMILAGTMLSLLGLLIVVFCHKNKVSSYEQLAKMLFGKKIGSVLELIISLMLWIGLAVMLIGSGSIFAEHWNFNLYFGIALTSIILISALLFKGSGVKWINSILIPFLVVVALWISILTIDIPFANQLGSGVVEYGLVGSYWFIGSIIYVAYNMVLGIVILTSLDPTNLKVNGVGTVLGGFFLTVIGVLKVAALLTYYPKVFQYEIPMLFLAGEQTVLLKFLFTIALWTAMVTTAVANAYGLAKRLENFKWLSYQTSLFLILLSTLPLAKYRFSELVAVFYPILGYISLFIVGMLISQIIWSFSKFNSRKLT